MYIEPVKTENDYDRALARIESLMGAAADTPEGDELDMLLLIVKAYEDKHHPIDPPDPIEAILFRMDQMGLNRNDLVPLIGSKSKVSEVLNYKRPLSLNMIRKFHNELKIPSDVLLRELNGDNRKYA